MILLLTWCRSKKRSEAKDSCRLGQPNEPPKTKIEHRRAKRERKKQNKPQTHSVPGQRWAATRFYTRRGRRAQRRCGRLAANDRARSALSANRLHDAAQSLPRHILWANHLSGSKGASSPQRRHHTPDEADDSPGEASSNQRPKHDSLRLA